MRAFSIYIIHVHISGAQESSCSSGTYYLTEIPNTNVYLLVIDNWMSEVMETRIESTIGLTCLVDRTYVCIYLIYCGILILFLLLVPAVQQYH